VRKVVIAVRYAGTGKIHSVYKEAQQVAYRLIGVLQLYASSSTSSSRANCRIKNVVYLCCGAPAVITAATTAQLHLVKSTVAAPRALTPAVTAASVVAVIVIIIVI
jgi:hypothetical protein